MKIRYALGALCGVCLISMSAANALTPKEKLGKSIFFDENLSEPAGQACASCHDPDFGFVDPDTYLPVSEGVISGLYGGRNAPSVAYAMFNPILHFDEMEGLWIGGVFWDGRATGNTLGDPLADQANGPFLNPINMANDSKAQVVADVANSDYATLFEMVWGTGSLNDIEAAYDQIALSLAAFERTRSFGRFSSKYDIYLRNCLTLGGQPDDCAKGIEVYSEEAGTIFTRKEWRGLQLFMGWNNNDGDLAANEGANCAACHAVNWTETELDLTTHCWSPAGLAPPLFTNYGFDNLGIPVNPQIEDLIGQSDVDLALGQYLWWAGYPPEVYWPEFGKFKIMSLRNISKTRPYGHNGYFTELPEIVHFINTRDVEDWPSPEVPETVTIHDIGNLGLTADDEDALVKFLMTLTDDSGRGSHKFAKNQAMDCD